MKDLNTRVLQIFPFSFTSSSFFFFSFFVLPFSTFQFHFTHYFRNKGQQIIKFISTMPCPKSSIPKIRCFDDVVKRKIKNRKRRINKLIHICLSLFSKVCFPRRHSKRNAIQKIINIVSTIITTIMVKVVSKILRSIKL